MVMTAGKNSNLPQNPQEAFIAANVCFLTNFTQLEITKMQASYWWGQMHCGSPNQNFGLAMAHAAEPPMDTHRNGCLLLTTCGLLR